LALKAKSQGVSSCSIGVEAL
jgi:hypothetical protein